MPNFQLANISAYMVPLYLRSIIPLLCYAACYLASFYDTNSGPTYCACTCICTFALVSFYLHMYNRNFSVKSSAVKLLDEEYIELAPRLYKNEARQVSSVLLVLHLSFILFA